MVALFLLFAFLNVESALAQDVFEHSEWLLPEVIQRATDRLSRYGTRGCNDIHFPYEYLSHEGNGIDTRLILSRRLEESQKGRPTTFLRKGIAKPTPEVAVEILNCGAVEFFVYEHLNARVVPREILYKAVKIALNKNDELPATIQQQILSKAYQLALKYYITDLVIIDENAFATNDFRVFPPYARASFDFVSEILALNLDSVDAQARAQLDASLAEILLHDLNHDVRRLEYSHEMLMLFGSLANRDNPRVLRDKLSRTLSLLEQRFKINK